jgi:hypothetical protein
MNPSKEKSVVLPVRFNLLYCRSDSHYIVFETRFRADNSVIEFRISGSCTVLEVRGCIKITITKLVGVSKAVFFSAPQASTDAFISHTLSSLVKFKWLFAMSSLSDSVAREISDR